MLDWVWSFSARPRSASEIAAQRAVKLERMRWVLDALGSPERAFPCLLVAGTKGKGSTVAMLAAALQASGLRTGRYTSPHLVNWRERTCVDAEPIGTADVLALVGQLRPVVEQLPTPLGPPTTFEVGTALTLMHFARRHVDVAVLEVGVGGRFDATNVVEPSVSVITSISYDHTQTLGSTLSAIASHKAGILRRDRPAVLAPQPEEARLTVEAEACRVGACLQEVGRDWTWRVAPDSDQPPSRARIRIEAHVLAFEPLEVQPRLLGEHQRDNATAAVAALQALPTTLRASREAMQQGIETVDWPGRLQVLREAPWLVLDGAHNAASAVALRTALGDLFAYERLYLVIGLSAGKDARGVLEALAPLAHSVYLTRSHHERSASPVELGNLLRGLQPAATVHVRADVASAIQGAVGEAGQRDLVLVTGSLFVVGEALVWWRLSPR